MQGTIDHDWKKEFARSAAYRAEQDRFFRMVERRLDKAHKGERLEEDVADIAISAVLATDEQIFEFRVKLDDYRTATVESLMENERQLVEVRKRLDDTLSKAYVLPDGRRVFKTEDGLRVFDEHGMELSAEDIDPNAIEDWRPRAEGYLESWEVEQHLVEDREARLKLLDRIDEMDALAESGDMTTDDLEDFERELKAIAPSDINNRVAGIDPDDIAPISRDFGAAAAPFHDSATGPKLDVPAL